MRKHGESGLSFSRYYSASFLINPNRSFAPNFDRANATLIMIVNPQVFSGMFL